MARAFGFKIGLHRGKNSGSLLDTSKWFSRSI